MNFPASIKALQDDIAVKRSMAKAASDETNRLRQQVKEQEQRQKEREAIAEILDGLFTSWRAPDPGKYRDAYFFLDIALEERAVVQEFLPENVKVCKTRNEWEEYASTRSWQRASYDSVPYWYQIVNLDAVGKGECSKCHSAQPVVEHYAQTYDSPTGDAWLREHFVFCLDCDATTILKLESKNRRF